MRIGYACLTVGVDNASFKSCIMKNAAAPVLFKLIEHNLTSLGNKIDYNAEMSIRLYRISSEIIPFASSPDVLFLWREIFAPKLSCIGEKARQKDIRLSMHASHYTILNSNRTEVVINSIADLNYHCDFLDSLGMNADNKIIIHIGGAYNDKKEAVKRFITNYEYLSSSLKKRLVIENDDRIYNINDVLEISSILNIPVVFDVFHNEVNPCENNKSVYDLITDCKKTWNKNDGNQKIHYSQQEAGKKPGSHSQTIHLPEFMEFYKGLERDDIDIMLEVKDKNLSALKCLNCIEK